MLFNIIQHATTHDTLIRGYFLLLLCSGVCYSCCLVCTMYIYYFHFVCFKNRLLFWSSTCYCCFSIYSSFLSKNPMKAVWLLSKLIMHLAVKSTSKWEFVLKKKISWIIKSVFFMLWKDTAHIITHICVLVGCIEWYRNCKMFLFSHCMQMWENRYFVYQCIINFFMEI